MAFDFCCKASGIDDDGVAAECMPLAVAYCDACGGVDERYFGFGAACGDCIDWLTCFEVCDCVPRNEHRWRQDWWMLVGCEVRSC